MKHRSTKGNRPGASAVEFLRAVPYGNQGMTVTPADHGGALAEVPMNRPRWLVPPISWLLPFSTSRRIQLDAIGYAVLKLCDGRNVVETIIEQFAAGNKLSFREAQLPVTRFIHQMMERGLVAVMGSQQEADKR
jgi:hypothetical protein